MPQTISLDAVINVLYQLILNRDAGDLEIEEQLSTFERTPDFFNLLHGIMTSHEAMAIRLERDRSIVKRVFANLVCSAQERKYEEFTALINNLKANGLIDVSGVEQDSLLHLLSTGGSLYRLVERLPTTKRAKEPANEL